MATTTQTSKQTTTLDTTVQVIGKFRWTICALLFFATTVNYLDRQVLSLLAPSLSKEFGWTNTDYANITAAFHLFMRLPCYLQGRSLINWERGRFFLAIINWSLGAVMHA